MHPSVYVDNYQQYCPIKKKPLPDGCCTYHLVTQVDATKSVCTFIALCSYPTTVGCGNLNKITLPTTVGCGNLNKITLPTTVRYGQVHVNTACAIAQQWLRAPVWKWKTC
jgi:hypothetical protein